MHYTGRSVTVAAQRREPVSVDIIENCKYTVPGTEVPGTLCFKGGAVPTELKEDLKEWIKKKMNRYS